MLSITLKLTIAHFLPTSYLFIFSLSILMTLEKGLTYLFHLSRKQLFHRHHLKTFITLFSFPSQFHLLPSNFRFSLPFMFCLLSLLHQTLALVCSCYDTKHLVHASCCCNVKPIERMQRNLEIELACYAKGECYYIWVNVGLLLEWNFFENSKVVGRNVKLVRIYLDIF